LRPAVGDNAAHFILDLKPRVTKIGFKEIRLWVDRNSGLITRVSSKTVSGKAVEITFTGIKTNLNPALTKGLFYFGMPDANVQTIRNTILPAELVDKRR
jgi:outer membrane lipoprotein-sorting protein